MFRLPKDENEHFSQLVKVDLREEVVKKSMTLLQIHSTNCKLKSSPFLCGWLYQLTDSTG